MAYNDQYHPGRVTDSHETLSSVRPADGVPIIVDVGTVARLLRTSMGPV